MRNLLGFGYGQYLDFPPHDFTEQAESQLRDQVGVTIDGTRLSTEISLQDFNDEISNDVLCGKLKVTGTPHKSCGIVCLRNLAPRKKLHHRWV